MAVFLLIYTLSGSFVGFLAGLLGIGGGIIAVPVLLLLFSMQGVPKEVSMHFAVGTSIAIVMVTSFVSVYSHYRKGAILFPVFKQFLPGAILGSIIGIIIGTHLHSDLLQKLFGIFLLIVAAQFFFKINFKSEKSLPKKPILFSVSTLFGALSGMLGVGGGIFMVPFFTWCGIPIRNTVATSSACLLPIAVVGTIGYWIANVTHVELPNFNHSFIYFPAFICMSIASIFAAPLGVKLAHSIRTDILSKIFAVVLLATSIEMLL